VRLTNMNTSTYFVRFSLAHQMALTLLSIPF